MVGHRLESVAATRFWSCLLIAVCVGTQAAELVTLSQDNYREYAPIGKEADAILGDYVLRNDKIAATIGNPYLMPGGDGSRPGFYFSNIIDLVRRDAPNDLLNAYLPASWIGGESYQASALKLTSYAWLQKDFNDESQEYLRQGREARTGKRIVLTYPGGSGARSGAPRFSLEDGWPYVLIETTYKNVLLKKEYLPNRGHMREGQQVINLVPMGVIALSPGGQTPPVKWGVSGDARTLWVYDPWHGGAYAMHCETARLTARLRTLPAYSGLEAKYHLAETPYILKPLKSYTLAVKMFPGKDVFQIRESIAALAGEKLLPISFAIRGNGKPLADVLVTAYRGDRVYAMGKSQRDGAFSCSLPKDVSRFEFSLSGYPARTIAADPGAAKAYAVEMGQTALLEGTITDKDGAPIPCKTTIWGREETPTPDFFPETGSDRVKNVIYSATGTFAQALKPGAYSLVISRGFEYDIIEQDIELKAGETLEVKERLIRSVESEGWISMDVGGRSTVSKAASSNDRRGRVLNLLAEGIEFAPSAEEQYISDNNDVLPEEQAKYLKTCPAIYIKKTVNKSYIDLTIFPLPHKPWFQDGGAVQRPAHVLTTYWAGSWYSPLSGGGDVAWIPGTKKLMIASLPRFSPLRKAGAEHGWNGLFGHITHQESLSRGGRFAALQYYDAMEIQPLQRFLEAPPYDAKDPKGEAAIAAWQDSMHLLHEKQQWGKFSANPTTWLKVLNMGHRITGIVNSHATDNFHGNGAKRNYVRSPADTPAEIDPLAVVDAVRAGQVMVTTGPYLTVTASSKAAAQGVGSGGDLAAPDGRVLLDVAVQCPNWIQVDALKILVNGRVSPEHSLTREANAAAFTQARRQLKQRLEIVLEQDSHIMVVASGQGKDLNRRSAETPAIMPHLALTNPIYVDVDGKGFLPQSPLLDRVYTVLSQTRELSASAKGRPALVELTLRNLSPEVAEDSFQVRLSPPGQAEVVGTNRFSYRLDPGESTSIEIPFKLIGRAGDGGDLLEGGDDVGLDLDEATEAAAFSGSIQLFVPRSARGGGRRAVGMQIKVGGAVGAWRHKLVLPRDVQFRPRNWQHVEYYDADDPGDDDPAAGEQAERTPSEEPPATAQDPTTEWVTLHEDNYQEYAPKGKEADAIYGDYVLRNDLITAAIGNPTLQAGFEASRGNFPAYYSNIIDLTRRGAPNDLLCVYVGGIGGSGFRPHIYRSTSVPYHQNEFADSASGYFKKNAKKVKDRQAVAEWAFTGRGSTADWGRYTLADGWPYMLIEYKYKRGALGQGKAAKVYPAARIGLGPTTDHLDVEQGFDKEHRLYWGYDPWHGGAYGVYCEQARIEATTYTGLRHQYHANKGGGVELSYRLDPGQGRQPGGLVFGVRLFPAQDVFKLRQYVAEWKKETLHPVVIAMDTDAAAPERVLISAYRRDELYGLARVRSDAPFKAMLPAGKFRFTFRAPGGVERELAVAAGEQEEYRVTIAARATLKGGIVDGAGKPIPFKLTIWGRKGTATPDFAPETGDERVRNVIYSAGGSFVQPLAPGAYDLIISRGSEYDVVRKQVDLAAGAVVAVDAVLKRSVSTPGWVSVDIGSRTTVSKALSKSSRRGRVLNLLAEGIEFAPTVEGQYVSDLSDILTGEKLGQYLKSCPGIYLKDYSKRTGLGGLTIFPAVHRPRVQDGGAVQRPYGVYWKPFWVNSWYSPLSGQGDAGWNPGTEKVMIASFPTSTPAFGNWSNWLFGIRGANEDPTTRGRFAALQGIHAMEVQPLVNFAAVPAFDPADPKGERDLAAWKARMARFRAIRTEELARHRRPETWDKDSVNPTHWLRILNLGYRIPAMVNSHADDNLHGNGGLRNYVRSGADSPATIDPLEIVRNIRRGQVMVTTGPFLQVQAHAGRAAALPGGDLSALGGRADLEIRVQCPNWITLEAVNVLVNGRVSQEHSLTRKLSPGDFANGAVQFEKRIPLALKQDSHIVVVAIGKGLNLTRRTSDEPATKTHVAMTNPIYIDVGSDGFSPQSPLLDQVYAGLYHTKPLSAIAIPGRVNRKGKVVLILRNLSKQVARDELTIQVSPKNIVKFHRKPSLRYELKPGEERTYEFELSMLSALAADPGDEDELGLDEEGGEQARRAPAVTQIQLHIPRSAKGVGRREAALSVPVNKQPAHHQMNVPHLPSDVGARPPNWQHEEFYGK